MMIVEITMIVEVRVSVMRSPMILEVLVGSMTEIPAITQTMIVEITMIVEVGVSVVRSPMILDMLVGSMTKIPVIT
jgi:hypothetical protein